ncbi:MAG: hypothetical protein ABFD08_17485 [Syntrophomonas sp.]
MFSPGFMDYKNSIGRKLFDQDKVDPGSLSFMENGWWALHAAAITGLFILGHSMGKRSHNQH